VNVNVKVKGGIDVGWNNLLNPMMRRIIVLGWMLSVGFLQAEVPMDLNSPFLKVALVKGKTGEVETREIKQARLIGDRVEMEKVEGGVAFFLKQDVLVILPLLPKADGPYTVEQAEGAIRLYQKASPELLQKAGVGSTGMQDWEKLKQRLLEIKSQQEEKERRNKEAQEAETKANLTKEVQDWVAQASDFRASRPEKELTELKQKGEALARKSPEQMEVILQALAVLSQVQPKEKGEPLPELSKLNEVQPRLIPDDLLGWLAGGVLILSFFGLLFGLAFLSSSLTRFKEGALLGGIVFGIVTLGLFGVLVWTWLPAQVIGEAVPSRADPKMEELGIYLKNRAKSVYYFPAKQFSFSAEEWRAGVLGYLPVSEESVGLFKVKLKEGELRLTEGKWTWQQPLTALGIPLPFQLTFEGPTPELQNWENPAVSKVSLGRWTLPESISGLLKDSASSIMKQGLASAGLAGVSLNMDDKGMFLISVPAAGTRPKYELAKEEDKQVEAAEPVSAYKKELSAEELARAFMENKGKEFQGKFVVIEGVVEKISSGSEYSGVSLASRGESNLNPEKAPAKIKEDDFDIFYLRGADSYGFRRDPLFIKLVIKSPGVFVMDPYGDVYVGPRANIVKQTPLIKRGYRVKFLSEGRVQSDRIQNNEIEVYGISLGANGEGLEFFDPAARSPQ